MLSKIFRFHGYGSLKFVYGKGKTARTKYMNLKYIKNNRRTESRLAVVVSKKVVKQAPARNRMRRRVFEAVRLRWPLVEPGYDLVITIFDERIGTISTNELTALTDDLLAQAHVLKNN